MPPSFTCVIKTKAMPEMKSAVKRLNTLLDTPTVELSNKLLGDVPITGLNHILFRCEPEEKEISEGKRGPYGLDNYGPMKYSGIASYMTILRTIKLSADMGHELFNNMR